MLGRLTQIIFIVLLGATSAGATIRPSGPPHEGQACVDALTALASQTMFTAIDVALSRNPKAVAKEGFPSAVLVHDAMMVLTYWAHTTAKNVDENFLKMWLERLQEDPVALAKSVSKLSYWSQVRGNQSQSNFSVPRLFAGFSLPKAVPLQPILETRRLYFESESNDLDLTSATADIADVTHDSYFLVNIFTGSDVALMKTYLAVNLPFFSRRMTNISHQQVMATSRNHEVLSILAQRLDLFKQYESLILKIKTTMSTLEIFEERKQFRQLMVQGRLDTEPTLSEKYPLAILNPAQIIANVSSDLNEFKRMAPRLLDYVFRESELNLESFKALSIAKIESVRRQRGEIYLDSKQEHDLRQAIQAAFDGLSSAIDDKLESSYYRWNISDYLKSRVAHFRNHIRTLREISNSPGPSGAEPWAYITKNQLEASIREFEGLRDQQTSMLEAITNQLLIRRNSTQVIRVVSTPYR